MDDKITTPEACQLYDFAKPNENTKKRVLKADPNGGRCLITNKDDPMNFCHCIPRKMMKETDIVRVYRIHYLF
jgi:hypothetical protein